MSSRYRIYRPDQVWWFSVLARTADMLSSLSLAVILIFTLAGTLAFATFVEARYGTPSVQFYVYQTWWFDAILVLLALNILFAAMVRYPWKRYQTGFVITHIGLLTLISGAALSRLYGIDSQVMVYEDHDSKWAWGDDFKISFRELTDSQSVGASSKDSSTKEQITFRGGPMNWIDYKNKFSFSAPLKKDADWREQIGRSLVQGTTGLFFNLPFRHQPGDILFERDDIQIKVLDYYSNSTPEGPLALRVGGLVQKKTIVNEEDGTSKEVSEPPIWSDVPTLYTTAVRDRTSYPLGVGGKSFVGGGFFTFSLATSNDQVQAFLDSAPKTPFADANAKSGIIVLHAQGKRFEFGVDEKLGKGKFPLEGTPFEIEIADYSPSGRTLSFSTPQVQFVGQPGANMPDSPLVNLLVYKQGKQSGRLALLSESPDLNIHDYENGVFGAYWFNQSFRSREERARLRISSRIEVLRSPDQKLYYRYWNLSEVVAAGELPTSGTEETAIDAFKMPIGQLKMYVARYTPCDGPGKNWADPLDFKRDTPATQTSPAVHLEIIAKNATGKTTSTKKWLRAAFSEDPTVFHPDDRLLVAGGKRKYELTMLLDAIDIGFRVKLDKFERKLDPGTSQASHYSSTIDLLDVSHTHELRVTDSRGNRAQQLKLEGCDPGKVVAIDPLRGDLFLSDAAKPVIWRITTGDQMSITEFTDGILGNVTSLSVDSKSRSLYWIETNGPRNGALLMTMSLSGQTAQRVHAFSVEPKYIAIDSESQRLYFADPVEKQIQYLDLKSKAVTRIPGEVESLAGLVVVSRPASEPQIYYASSKSNRVFELKSGESEEVIRLPKGHSPLSLALAAETNGLLLGVAVETPYPAGAAKPPAQRLPDAIIHIDLKSQSQSLVVNDRVYSPASITADPQTGRVYWIQTASFGEDMWITMNAPIDVDDPISGRSYRVFQESFAGPFLPGSPEYNAIVPASVDKDELYRSYLSVNYDPGRGIRSAGCVLVIIGVAVMFFMRAYFFTPRPKAAPSPILRSSLAKKTPDALAVEV